MNVVQVLLLPNPAVMDRPQMHLPISFSQHVPFCATRESCPPEKSHLIYRHQPKKANRRGATIKWTVGVLPVVLCIFTSLDLQRDHKEKSLNLQEEYDGKFKSLDIEYRAKRTEITYSNPLADRSDEGNAQD